MISLYPAPHHYYLTLNAFIEEGFEMARLERIVVSLANAAREANVSVVAGDTKVLPRGEGGGLYLAATGVGVRPKNLELGLNRVQPGDAILVSGPDRRSWHCRHACARTIWLKR